MSSESSYAYISAGAAATAARDMCRKCVQTLRHLTSDTIPRDQTTTPPSNQPKPAGAPAAKNGYSGHLRKSLRPAANGGCGACANAISITISDSVRVAVCLCFGAHMRSHVFAEEVRAENKHILVLCAVFVLQMRCRCAGMLFFNFVVRNVSIVLSVPRIAQSTKIKCKLKMRSHYCRIINLHWTIASLDGRDENKIAFHINLREMPTWTLIDINCRRTKHAHAHSTLSSARVI